MEKASSGYYEPNKDETPLPTPSAKPSCRFDNSSPYEQEEFLENYQDDLFDPQVETLTTGLQAVKIQSPPWQPKILTIADLKSVRKLLFGVRRKWYDIGIELEIPIEKLDTIRAKQADYGACLIEMIKEWLNSEVAATWKALAEALRAEPVKEVKLADEGERLKCVKNECTPFTPCMCSCYKRHSTITTY